MPARDQSKPIANGPEIIRRRVEAEYRTRAAFVRTLEDKTGSGLSKDTIAQCEGSELGIDKEWRPDYGIFKCLADFLNCEPKDLYYAPDEVVPWPKGNSGMVDCLRQWFLRGDDVEVVDYFEYPNGPKGITATVEIKLDTETGLLTADGIDHDKDPCQFSGRVRDNGRKIVGEYEINTGRQHIYGSLMLVYHNCGRLMTGYYVGLGTEHGSELILVQVTLKRV